MNKFSVLIANYNNGLYFKACWDSLLKQSIQNFEVIIVDDASKDNSVALIKELVQNDVRVKLFINEENKGCGYTKNKCVSLATGEICGFLDSDDALYPNALEKMVLAHNLHADAAIVSAKYDLVDLEMNFKSHGTHGESIPENESFLTHKKSAITHFVSFKKSYYLKTEGINPEFKRAVDHDLYLKLEEAGRHVFINDYLYKYRINENSISCNDNLYKAKYWHFRAQQDAYFRRKLKPELINFSMEEFSKIKTLYYIKRAEVALNQKKYCLKFYFLFISIFANPALEVKHKIKLFFKF